MQLLDSKNQMNTYLLLTGNINSYYFIYHINYDYFSIYYTLAKHKSKIIKKFYQIFKKIFK